LIRQRRTLQTERPRRGRLALLLARNVGAICASGAALAARVHRSEAGLREQLASYDRDPSAGASAGISPVKASGAC
jgi:hypothetical protein